MPRGALKTLLLAPWVGLLALACGSGGSARPELVVYAASSLRDVLTELAPQAEAVTGARLALNLGSSGDLARQILAGGRADLFFAADELELARVEAELAPGTRTVLLSNRLVVVEPADDGPSLFRVPFTPDQLARAPLLSLADPATVPAGRYAKAWLSSRGAWAGLEARVLPALDARAALAAVESGAARAGIVYATDAARSTRVRLVHAVPSEEGPTISYPLGVLAQSREPLRARRLAGFLASPEAAAAFERHGFVVVARGQ